MEYVIKEYETYDANEILPLYEDAGWANYTKHCDMLEKAYNNSQIKYAAYIGDKLVGIVRAVSDGASILYVQDLIVRSDFQRQGIGSALLNRILKDYKNVYQIVLATDNTEKTMSFYKSLGFCSGKEIGCVLMIKINV